MPEHSGWYFNVGSIETGSRLQSLPPILRKFFRKPMSSCSEGSRGLSVLSWVKGIFTPSATSLSPCLRQWGSRYAIRAGRNLPDKEFRYLRTIIVIAGVHPRFGHPLARDHLTFGHWPGISSYTSACAFAGTCVFGKQSLEPIHCGPLGLHRQAASPYWGAPSPEVTERFCRVP